MKNNLITLILLDKMKSGAYLESVKQQNDEALDTPLKIHQSITYLMKMIY